MKFAMIKDLVNNKEISFLKSWKDSNKYFLRIIALRFFVFIIYSTVVLIIGAIGLYFGKNISLIIGAMMFIVLILFLYFRNAILFIEDKNSLSALLLSFKYFRKNYKHVLNVFIISTVIGAAFNFFIPFNSINEFIIFSTINVLSVVLNIVFDVWSDLFLFFSFKSKGF